MLNRQTLIGESFLKPFETIGDKAFWGKRGGIHVYLTLPGEILRTYGRTLCKDKVTTQCEIEILTLFKYSS